MSIVHATALPAAPAVRGRNLLVATSFAIAATLMYFGGLFGIYFAERSVERNAGRSWIPDSARIELTPPGMIMWTLLISVAVMQWAVYSIKRDDRPHALLAVGATLAMGAMVLVQSGWQFVQMELVADETAASALIYTIAGSFMVAILIGMLFVILVGFRALAGQYSSRQTDGIVAASLYWYTLVFIYFIIWIGVFIAK
jgi:heme/copper-type cytochrome/quinol oxidase subunit 3